MFIRVKTISGKKYAYLCESVWRDQKNQQVVKQYLGKIFDAGETPAISAVVEINKEHLLTQLLSQTLGAAGFSKNNEKEFVWSREIDGQILHVNEQSFAVKNEKDKEIIIKVNDGYICSQTLLSLHKILQEPSTDQGQELARSFVDCGFRLEPELFVTIFTRLFSQNKPAVHKESTTIEY